MKGILGRKLGMTQVFTTEGVLVPVTVIECEPNVVMQVKTVETDGYNAVQLGMEEIKKASKPIEGHAKKAGVAPRRYVQEVRDCELNLEVGNEVKVDIFSAGDKVDITGTSKGKGYTGHIKRYHHHMINESHGAGPVHRSIGSLSTSARIGGVIPKNTPMPGHDGSLTTTNQNLEVIKVDAEKNYILVKGNVPGPKRGLVMVKTTVKKIKHVDGKELLNRKKEAE